MRKTILAMCALLTTLGAYAQKKVFKEVGEGISSQLKVIRQDNTLVGYLAFTELEKTNKDSFNYKITIMDENLNDIGTVNFKNKKLTLQSVAFEQDVICLAYIKSSTYNQEFKTKKEYKKVERTANDELYMQFLSLEGKIINTKDTRLIMQHSTVYVPAAGVGRAKLMSSQALKHGVQLSNIPQKGFACFYGDDEGKNLLIYNTAGEQTWKKKVTEDAEGYRMLVSNQDIFFLCKQYYTYEGSYKVFGFGTADSSVFPTRELKDKQGNPLKVLAFENDPVTGKLYISGNIITKKRMMKFRTAKHLSTGAYAGVFTMNVADAKTGEYKEMYTYWSDKSKANISRKGYFKNERCYTVLEESFRDYDGNTYFVGNSLYRKTNIGGIIASVITAPLIVPPIVILTFGGSERCKVKDPVVIKQDQNGNIAFEKYIPSVRNGFRPASQYYFLYDNNDFSVVNNTETKNNYIIVYEPKNIVIFDVKQNKPVRSIPRKDGNTYTAIYPAKEGHIMVSEFDLKEHSTSLSIEAL